MLPAPFYLSQHIAQSTLVVKGYVKQQAIVNICMGVANVILVVILSCFLDVLGAAIAICISYTVRNVGMCIVYRKKLDLNMNRFYIECYIKTLPGIILTFIAACGINLLIPNYSWIGLIFKVACIVGCYAIFMWFLAFNDYEKNLAINTVKKLLKRRI